MWLDAEHAPDGLGLSGRRQQPADRLWQLTTDSQGHTVLTKNGATSRGGFVAIVIVVPELSCGVAVLSNQYFDASGVH